MTSLPDPQLPPENLLGQEASPYLRQHAENPVHWRAWSPAALAEAAALDRPILLSIGYALIGWRIGLGFTRSVIRHAARVLPQIALSILVLMGFSASLAALLVVLVGVDPLTAYLATSPGGMDSIAVIAASSPVDMSFVMALQAVRFFIIVLTGPPVAHFVARRLHARAPPGEAPQ